ncbi:tRNA guanosine-2'-O-methyltransferase, putative [Plasmodium sp. DRC-Itaito]|nr:tRNA guanosine-2'-O-methyltransferase, putative [Plasmodium sp. DRC-Itaito]
MPFLIWFSSHNKYDDCKISELNSLLEIYGYRKKEYDEKEKKKENDKEKNEGYNINHIELFEAVKKSSVRKNIEWEEKFKVSRMITNKFRNEVFLKTNISEEDLWVNVISRSVLIKGVIELWSEGNSYNEILKELLLKKDLFEKTLKDKKWCFCFNSYGKIINQEEKVDKMNFFKILLEPYTNIDLINPQVQIGLIEEYEQENYNSTILKKVYFGKCIALRRNQYMNNLNKIKKDHKIIGKPKIAWWTSYALNKRPILGPTTTDNDLAFIMCNIAKIKKGHIVLDPFVGSGGLLVTSSIFDAICIGNDIDIRLLKGYKLSYLNPHMKHKSNNKSIFENFVYYNLNIPEIIVSDNSKPIWNFFHKPWVDAIITDPPYGNRATVRICVTNNVEMNVVQNNDILPTSLKNQQDINDNNNNNNDNNFCSSEEQLKKKEKNISNAKTITYNCISAVKDLLNIASNVLVDNGMLVFLFPIQLDTIEEEINILKHPDFYLISYDLQTFTPITGRLIVSMQRKARNA